VSDGDFYSFLYEVSTNTFNYKISFSKNLSDDNILKLFDGFRINDEIFLVLSILDGKKFTDFYRDFSLIDIKRYMYNLLSCLENIHRIGIVHRDLKPDNFLYNPDTHKCLLIDFGLAEIVSDKT
jgi:cell division control protein 7